MSEGYPNLAGIATKNLVEKKGGGSFSASYINWSRTLQLLREHAPGWSIETLESPEGGILFRAPVGGYLMIRIRHSDGPATPAVPQAIMDNRNNSVPFDKITSRDITDTHRRGACMALAMHFGLAYELWAKDELESGYHSEAPVEKDRFSPTSDELVKRVNAKRSSDAAQKVNATAPEKLKPMIPRPTSIKSMKDRLAVAMDDKEPDPSRPVGNVYEAIERIKNCKTAKGATKSLKDSVWRFRFSKNDRSQLQEALDYRVSKLEKGDE